MRRINSAIFREYDIRGKYPEEINESSAYALGRAFVLSQHAKRIAISRDRRIESEKIYPDFVKGVKETGCEILDLGINSTPALFFAVGIKKLDGGVSITASHNPKGYTGLKMCDKNGTLLGLNTGIKKLIAVLKKEPKTKKLTSKESRAIDINKDYFNFAKKIVDVDNIKGFKIVLDASNGSGARLADYFFVRLHSKITKMNFKLGDQFEDHGLNPMLAENRKLAKREVIKRKADIGVIFDGDGDRCIFIDEKGEYIPPYYINFLLAEIILKKHRLASMVIDARMIMGLTNTIKNFSGKPIISRAGYSNVVKKMQARNSLFGCENSGHYFFNFKLIDRNKKYIFGDAIIPILLVLEYLKKNRIKLSEAVAIYRESYPISGEINIKDVNFSKIEKRIKNYAKYKKNKVDGISIYSDDWFFNIRPSKTEPLVRLNIEAKDKPTLNKIKKELLKII
jgi:phosphomannomutase